MRKKITDVTWGLHELGLHELPVSFKEETAEKKTNPNEFYRTLKVFRYAF